MEVQDQIRFLFAGFLIWLSFIRTKRVVSKLECVLQAGCGSLGVAKDWVPKRKGLGTNAEWWTRMGDSTFTLVVLHCKLLLSRQGLPVSTQHLTTALADK